MKKTLAIALAFGVASAFAQDLTSKKGEKILPEAGDWSIGFDALPVIRTVGNLIKSDTNTIVAGTGAATNYIMGKYFKDEKTAYRVMLGINFGSETTKTLVDQSGATATPPNQLPQVENATSVSTRSITLGGGLEKRKGSTRLQGFYGAMLNINFSGGGTSTTYGNALSATNSGTRTTSISKGSTFGIGVNGFIGAEYFVLPKLSLGAEYWWGLGFTSTGGDEETKEYWNGSSTQSFTTKSQTNAGGSSFGINGDYGSGRMFVNLHF